MPEPEVDKVDHSPDAEQVAAEERAKDSRLLTENDLGNLFGTLGDGNNLDIADEDSSSQDTPESQDTEDVEDARRHPDPTDESDDEPVDSEEQEDAEDDSSSDDTESSDKSEGEESTEEEPQEEFEDIFISLDEAGQLGLKVQKQPATPAPEPDKSNLSDTERITMWQSTADKYKHEAEQLRTQIEQLNDTVKGLQDQLAVSKAQSQATTPFDKHPRDFIESGEEYVSEDQYDPSTSSGRAYIKFSNAFRKHESEQMKESVKAELRAERLQEQQKDAALKSVAYLRKMRPNDFTTETEVQDLVQWSQTVGESGLYLLSIARDISTKGFKLPASVIKQLSHRAPKNGAPKKSIATKPPAETPRKPQDDSDTQTLKKAGFLDVGTDSYARNH